MIKMVDIKAINVKSDKAGPYSDAMKIGNLIFISGQISDPTMKTIKEQTLHIFEKISKILEAGNSDISKIIKVTIFLKDINDFEKMNQIYEKFFREKGIIKDFPARTTLEISNLPKSNLKIEVDVIASV